MRIDLKRLKNLTTGILHTEMGHIYKDLEFFIGEEGIMTHMIPRANKALRPILQKKYTNPELWDSKFTPELVGDIEVHPINEFEAVEFWEAYKEMPNPLDGKDVVGVRV